LDPSVKP
jgi:hypothetical protein